MPNFSYKQIEMLHIVCILLLAGTNVVFASKPKHIYLLAGQSNMSGRGGVINNTWDYRIPLKDHPNPSILRLNANLTWVEARDPLHQDVDFNVTCGVGPGMSFANELLEKGSVESPIGLVPCAVGGRKGTKMTDWVHGGYLYDQLIVRATAAQQGGGKLEAMLWYQGESDTVTVEDADSYKRRLETFINDVRSDLGYPALPVVVVAITSGQGKYIETVRRAQYAVGRDLPNIIVVDAEGLRLQSDHLHLSAQAQVHLGKRLADACLKLSPKHNS